MNQLTFGQMLFASSKVTFMKRTIKCDRWQKSMVALSRLWLASEHRVACMTINSSEPYEKVALQ